MAFLCTPYAIEITVDSCSAVHETPERADSHVGSAGRAIHDTLEEPIGVEDKVICNLSLIYPKLHNTLLHVYTCMNNLPYLGRGMILSPQPFVIK